MTAKKNCADGPGQSQFPAQDPGCEHDGQYVDGGTRIEKGCCRSDAGPPCINPRKKGQYSAGADGKHRPGNRGHGIGENFFGGGAKVFEYRGLAHEYGNSARDEKGGDEAGEHMFTGVLLEHHECLQAGAANHGTCPGHVVGGAEDQYDQQQFPSFLHDVFSLRPLMIAGHVFLMRK